MIIIGPKRQNLFLSTPSARRATHRQAPVDRFLGISIHALREEGDPSLPLPPRFPRISIHALREEGDRSLYRLSPGKGISIHALREEGDEDSGGSESNLHYFYPRPPRGGRLDRIKANPALKGISIHALREEGDQ